MERSDLALVVAVCDAGSMSAAAQLLDVAPPVVTKRLAALESRLGQRLFQRTTRRVTPTPEGETLCERARLLLQGFTALESELQERKAEPTGLIRLAATLGFGRRWVGPALAAFQAQHPHIEIQLQLTEQLPDLAREGLDGAIWLWQVDGRQASKWVSRRLASNRRVLVASPAYLRQHGTPDTVDALLLHACLIVRENGRESASDAARATSQRFDVWQLHHQGDTTPTRVRVHGPLSSNSGELVRDWCVAGHGIMLRSLWDIAPQLASGELVQVLPDHCMPDADIHWLAPYRSDAPRRIRLLIDFLLAEFQHEPWKAKARL